MIHHDLGRLDSLGSREKIFSPPRDEHQGELVETRGARGINLSAAPEPKGN
jgi:hypothetical protein